MRPAAGYIDQDPDALRLTVTWSNFPRDDLCVYASNYVQLPSIRIDATIIGASHIVTFSGKRWQFHEVLACTELPGLKARPIGALQGRLIHRVLPGKRYEFRIHRVTWQDPEPPELVELVHQAQQPPSPNSFGLIQEFPRGNFGVTPKTVIWVGATADGSNVVVRTAHSYPNVRGLVLSQTRVALP